MPSHRRSLLCLLTCGLLPALTGAISVAAAPERPQTVIAAWHHHQANFRYFGVTSVYTCSGLIGKLRLLLDYLGARSDMKLTPSGCASLDKPVSSMVIGLDFYSLATAPVGTAGTVRARWTAFTLKPGRPSFMDRGECELVGQLKQLLLAAFATRGVTFRAACFPHQVTPFDYDVTGYILKAAH